MSQEVFPIPAQFVLGPHENQKWPVCAVELVNLPAIGGPVMTDLAEQLVAAAAGQGSDLTGENGLRTAFTTRVQSALSGEMANLQR